jgi:hypothetical protein
MNIAATSRTDMNATSFAGPSNQNSVREAEATVASGGDYRFGYSLIPSLGRVSETGVLAQKCI